MALIGYTPISSPLSFGGANALMAVYFVILFCTREEKSNDLAHLKQSREQSGFIVVLGASLRVSSQDVYSESCVREGVVSPQEWLPAPFNLESVLREPVLSL